MLSRRHLQRDRLRVSPNSRFPPSRDIHAGATASAKGDTVRVPTNSNFPSSKLQIDTSRLPRPMLPRQFLRVIQIAFPPILAVFPGNSCQRDSSSSRKQFAPPILIHHGAPVPAGDTIRVSLHFAFVCNTTNCSLSCQRTGSCTKSVPLQFEFN
jgi:hypothetical protein